MPVSLLILPVQNLAILTCRNSVVHSSYSRKVDICWFRTRACKYNVSVLGSYFECDGVKCTYFNFTWWLCKRSYSTKLKPNFAAKYGLHNTLEHTWLIRNGSHVHDVHVQRFQDSKIMNGELTAFPLSNILYQQVWSHVSTEQLRIFKCTWMKCLLLETNLASNVKPSIRILESVHVHIVHMAPISFWQERMS